MPALSGKIVFSSGKVGESQVWLADLSSNLCRRISDGSGNCIQPILSPGGVRAAYVREDASGSNLQVVDLNDDALRTTELANPSCSVKSPSFDPTGARILYLASNGQSIWMQDLESGVCERIYSDLPPTHSLCWSLTGSLYGASTDEDGNTNIWEQVLEPATRTSLSTGPALDSNISPSPQNSVVAFLSDRQLRSIGSRNAHGLSGNNRLPGKQNWQRRQSQCQGMDIWVMNSNGDLPVKITDTSKCARSLTWSADGSQLLYATEANDRSLRFGVLPMADLVQAYQRTNKSAVINAADQLRSLSRESGSCCLNQTSNSELRNAKSFHWISPSPATSIGQQKSFDSIPALAGTSETSTMQVD